MLKPKQNLLKKKQTKKDLNTIKQNNKAMYDFIGSLIETQTEYTNEQIENLKNYQLHLLNMNIIFSDMQKSMK